MADKEHYLDLDGLDNFAEGLSAKLDATYQKKGESGDAYTKSETDTLLLGKVDKVNGKGLSSNDYTDADKSSVGEISGLKENLSQLRDGSKNLLNLNNLEAQTINGVTFTPIYKNGGLEYINVNGTASNGILNELCYVDLVDTNTYILSGCPSGGADNTYALRYYNKSTGDANNDKGNGVTLTNKSGTYTINIRIQSGYVCNNLKFYPMIRLSSVTNSSYEPYYEGVISLNNDISQLSNETLDIKKLGWSVPKELGINNYLDADRNFHQRVGRVDLGSLNFHANKAGLDLGRFDSTTITNILSGTKNMFVSRYTVSDWAVSDMTIYYSNDKVFYICNNTYKTSSAADFTTAMQGVYLYYELANEIVTPIDGNEITNGSMISDAYSSAKTYLVGEYCIYNNALYKCITQCSNVLPTDTNYFVQTSVGEEMKNAKQPSNRYSLDRIQMFSNSLTGATYICPSDGLIWVTGNGTTTTFGCNGVQCIQSQSLAASFKVYKGDTISILGGGPGTGFFYPIL